MYQDPSPITKTQGDEAVKILRIFLIAIAAVTTVSAASAKEPKTVADLHGLRWERLVDVARASQIPEILAHLAKHPHPKVRSAVAPRPMLPIRAFETLSRDPHPIVQRSVAINPLITPEISWELAGKSTWSRRGVSYSPWTAPDILIHLATDPDEWVRWGVARNLSAPKAIRAQLTRDPDIRVQRAARRSLVQ